MDDQEHIGTLTDPSGPFDKSLRTDIIFDPSARSPNRFLNEERLGITWILSHKIGGWGWKRSGAESPTGNPSPAPIAIAPHASHARHDRSMARWISVARAKVGGHGSSPLPSRNDAPSRGCPFVHFEQGNITVFLRTRSSPFTKIRVS